MSFARHKRCRSYKISMLIRAGLTVVADGESRANFHGALGGSSFFRRFRLFEKVNRRLVVIVFQKIGSLLQTHATGRAGRVHVPRASNVLGLLTRFVRHRFSFLLSSAARGKSFLGRARAAGGSAAPPGDTKKVRRRRITLTSSKGLLDPPTSGSRLARLSVRTAKRAATELAWAMG